MVTATGDSTSSVEDIVIGTKIRIAGETESRPSFGLRFATKLPNASNESGLGLDTTDFFASVLVAKTMQSVRVVGNVGLGILGDPTRGDRQNDVLTYGLSLARALTQAAEVVGEINGRVRHAKRWPASGHRVARHRSSRRPLHDRELAGRCRDAVRRDVAATRASGSPPVSPTCSTRFRFHDASVRVVKAHAYGNDFLCAPADEAGSDLPALARAHVSSAPWASVPTG